MLKVFELEGRMFILIKLEYFFLNGGKDLLYSFGEKDCE